MTKGDIVYRATTGTYHRVSGVTHTGKIKMDGWKRRHSPEKLRLVSDSEAIEIILLDKIVQQYSEVKDGQRPQRGW